MNIAIVGLSPSTCDLAPFGENNWRVWGLLKDEKWHLMDCCFEMHDPGYLSERGYSEEYWHRCFVPTVMQTSYDDIPLSEPFPLWKVNQDVFAGFPRGRWDDQRDWYNSSVAYMMALAIYERALTIGIWGVDMKGEEEHDYQAPCLEYLIGLAVGRGIEVIVPEGPTEIGKYRTGGFPYKKRYGYL